MDNEKGFERGIISFSFLKDPIGCYEENYWGEGRVDARRPVRIQLSDLYKMIVVDTCESLEQMKGEVEKIICVVSGAKKIG